MSPTKQARVEMADLAAMGFDALLTGFSATEIKAMGNPGSSAWSSGSTPNTTLV